MIITAKFASTCPKCSKPIAVGTKVEWEKGSKATHVDCSAARPSLASAPAPGKCAKCGNTCKAGYSTCYACSGKAPSRELRGKWSGCRCGSIEGSPRDSDCRQCQYDNE